MEGGSCRIMMPFVDDGLGQFSLIADADRNLDMLVLYRRDRRISLHCTENGRNLIIELPPRVTREQMVSAVLDWLKLRLLGCSTLGAVISPNRDGGDRLGVLMGPVFWTLIPVREGDTYETARERIEIYGPAERNSFEEDFSFYLDGLLDDPDGIVVELVVVPPAGVLH